MLEGKPAPLWGFISVLVRFSRSSLTSILALQLLEYRPMGPSYLSFLTEANDYQAAVFFLPIFGVGAWLLSSALVPLTLKIFGRDGNIDGFMNVVGFALIVVMPIVWLLAWIGIAFGFYGANFTIPFHAAISIWEVGLKGIGLKRMVGMS
jgi:hypothetical protein